MKRFVVAGLLIASLTSCESAEVSSAKKYVADRMRDPSSVQFRNITRGNDGAVCGEFNAKNGYGAYGGFKMFYVGKTFRDIQPDEDKLLKPFYELLVHYCPTALNW